MEHRESRSLRIVSLVLCCGLALPLACAKKSSDTAEPTAVGAPVGQDEDSNTASVVVDPKIAEMCNIPTSKFDFDSASLSSSTTSALDALAACFIDGPAAGKSMRLVGHADPRGSEEYNLALGQRRAGSVSGYLSGRGVDDGRMETSSRGELDARGTDEASWSRDRRVEIFLAD